MKVVIEGKVDNFVCKGLEKGMVIEGDFSATDSYHSFQELYSHRIMLFICLMKQNKEISWKSRIHSDGSKIDNWFIAGMKLPSGDITYHIPDNFWELLSDITVLEKAPEWDSHTSEEVIRRLNNWSFTLGN